MRGVRNSAEFAKIHMGPHTAVGDHVFNCAMCRFRFTCVPSPASKRDFVVTSSVHTTDSHVLRYFHRHVAIFQLRRSLQCATNLTSFSHAYEYQSNDIIAVLANKVLRNCKMSIFLKEFQ